MIALTPIHSKVQKRMLQRMEVLKDKPISGINEAKGLTMKNVFTKTTFIRMFSNPLKNPSPIVIVGGELYKTEGGYKTKFGISSEGKQEPGVGQSVQSLYPNVKSVAKYRPPAGIKYAA